MIETLTAVQDRDMHRAINKLIRDEGLTGEDAAIAYEQWRQAGYAAVMAARGYGAVRHTREYKRAYMKRKRAEKAEASK